jgi:hypothetical protein
VEGSVGRERGQRKATDKLLPLACVLLLPPVRMLLLLAVVLLHSVQEDTKRKRNDKERWRSVSHLSKRMAKLLHDLG